MAPPDPGPGSRSGGPPADPPSGTLGDGDAAGGASGADAAPDEAGLVLIGGVEKVAIVIAAPDPAWATRFADERERIVAALPDARVEHIGSTSVPGLAAKPIVDILVIPKAAARDKRTLDEVVHALEGAGYALRVQEPGHRMLRTPARDVHVHVWADPAEDARHLRFRDWLRVDADDRARYEAVKRALAEQDWSHMNAYADAKSDVVAAIDARASAWEAAGRPEPPGTDADARR